MSAFAAPRGQHRARHPPRRVPRRHAGSAPRCVSPPAHRLPVAPPRLPTPAPAPQRSPRRHHRHRQRRGDRKPHLPDEHLRDTRDAPYCRDPHEALRCTPTRSARPCGLQRPRAPPMGPRFRRSPPVLSSSSAAGRFSAWKLACRAISACAAAASAPTRSVVRRAGARLRALTPCGLRTSPANP